MKKRIILLMVMLIILVSLTALTVSCSNNNKINVKFVINGEVYDIQQYTPGEYISEPTVTEYKGYSFNQWILDNYVRFFPIQAGAEDMTFVAQTSRQYLVNFNADNLIVATAAGKLGTNIILPDAPSKAGYTFTGWYYNGTKELYQSGANFVLNNEYFKDEYSITLTAKYSKNYILSYVVDDVLKNEYEISEGQSISINNGNIPSNPIKTGHDFVCWVDQDGNLLDQGTIITQNTVYYAKFEKKELTVNYTNGSEVTSIKVKYNECAPELKINVSDTEDYYGWARNGIELTKDGQYIEPYDFTKPVTTNLNLTARVYSSKYDIQKQVSELTSKKINVTGNTYNAHAYFYDVSHNFAFNSSNPITVNFGKDPVTGRENSIYIFQTGKFKDGTGNFYYSFLENIAAIFYGGSGSLDNRMADSSCTKLIAFPAPGYNVGNTNSSKTYDDMGHIPYDEGYYVKGSFTSGDKEQIERFIVLVYNIISAKLDSDFALISSKEKVSQGIEIPTITTNETLTIRRNSIYVDAQLSGADSYTFSLKVYQMKQKNGVDSKDYEIKTEDGNGNKLSPYVSDNNIVVGLTSKTAYTVKIKYTYMVGGYSFVIEKNVVPTAPEDPADAVDNTGLVFKTF